MKNTNSRQASLLGLILLVPFIAMAAKDTLHNNAGSNNLIVLNTSVPRDNPPATSPTNSSKVNILYRIQILALQHPINVATVKVDGVEGKVYSAKSDDLTRYYMGEFHDFKSADDFRQQLVNSGFVDACIVAYINDKRITIKESKALLGEDK
jgi:hypothetical protein